MADAQDLTHEQLLQTRLAQAKTKYAIKTARIGAKPTPGMLCLHPERVQIMCAPPDLQFAVFLAMYTQLALAVFVAQELLDWDVNRVPWYYGCDHSHAFSWRFANTRYNVILMCFAWASGFDTEYCKPGYEEFVKAFVMVRCYSNVVARNHPVRQV